MKKVRVKIGFGLWYYTKITANDLNGLDGDIFTLFNSDKEEVMNFGYFGDMIHYIETGIII